MYLRCKLCDKAKLDACSGAVGKPGPIGPLGPVGPQGVQGPVGMNGMNGKQGEFFNIFVRSVSMTTKPVSCDV